MGSDCKKSSMDVYAAFIILTAFLILFLTGCAFVPGGREPFGEKTYSQKEAQAAYERVCAELLQRNAGDMGYIISYMTGAGGDNVTFYKTEEYTSVYAEDSSGEMLWYEGCLYPKKGDRLIYRELSWEDMHLDETAAEMWEAGRILLAQQSEKLTYKYVPMAGDTPFLIKAEYPAERYRDGKLYSYFSASLQEDGSCDGFSLEWQYVKKAEDETFDTTVCGISFQPWQGSASLQAERRLWAFGYDCGLTDEKVPALSVQEKEREHCRSVMAGMDFEALKGRASYKGDLMLQSVPDREILEFAE